MESETIDISSESDVSIVTKAAANSSKRRSSIFRPNEDYDMDASEEEWPEEYKINLQLEEIQWKKLYNLSYHEYKEIRKKSKQLQSVTVDKTVLNKQQQEFLNQGPSHDRYLKVVEEFSKKLLLCHALYVRNSKTKEIERECLLSKMNFVENMLLERLKCE